MSDEWLFKTGINIDSNLVLQLLFRRYYVHFVNCGLIKSEIDNKAGCASGHGYHVIDKTLTATACP